MSSTVTIDEILAYEPTNKKSRLGQSNGHSEEGPLSGDTAPASADQILSAVEADLGNETLDEAGVKRLISNFDKKMLKNTEMRIKFADEPVKFMESEIELNTAIQELHALATMPDHYPLLSEAGGATVPNLMQLLGHHNADIAIATVNLLQELTDLDTLQESEEGATSLIEALLDANLIGLLVQTLDSLKESEPEQADGIHDALTVIENLLEYNSELCDKAHEYGLLMWLVKRVRHKAYDANKLFASELLCVLLQQSDECRKILGNKDGIDILLQALATFKRRDPESADEKELMENLFDSMCAALMYIPNRAKFLDGEGLQLMNLMLRERKSSRNSALKILSYATNGEEGAANCEKLVEILGLRTLFPLFMKTPDKKKRSGHSSSEIEEHVCSILASLLRNCSQANRLRIIRKFTEQEHEKVDRLVELHLKYWSKVERFRPADTTSSSTDPDAQYLAQLDAGLFTLQLVDVMLADICVAERSIGHHARKLMAMKASGMFQVRKTLGQYLERLDPDAKKEHDRVKTLLEKL